MKQTAIEWLVETIDKKYINAFLSRIIEKAKEIIIGYFNCELAASLAYQNKLKTL